MWMFTGAFSGSYRDVKCGCSLGLFPDRTGMLSVDVHWGCCFVRFCGLFYLRSFRVVQNVNKTCNTVFIHIHNTRTCSSGECLLNVLNKGLMMI